MKIMLYSLIFLFMCIHSIVFAQHNAGGAHDSVRNYLKHVNTDIVPSIEGTYNLGSSNKNFSTVNVNHLIANQSIESSGSLRIYSDIIAYDGVNALMTLKGAEGSNNNNEDLTIDFDTSTANKITIDSTTGANWISFNQGDSTMISLADDSWIFQWRKEGFYFAQIGIPCGGLWKSGYLCLIERDDRDVAARDIWEINSNPTFRIYSADHTSNYDYIELYHDQSDAIINIGSGALEIETAGQLIHFRCGNAIGSNARAFLSYADTNDSPLWGIYGMNSYEETNIWIDDDLGNQINITNYGNRLLDHDHTPQTNPTVYIHSDTSPDTSNNQWGSFAHDQEDFVIMTGARVGTGTGATTDQQDIAFYPQGTEKFDIHGVGLYGATVDQITISDTGADADAATHTLQPDSSYVEIDCQDDDGCEITMSETDANGVAYEAGQEVKIVCEGTFECVMKDSAGVLECGGDQTLTGGAYDNITLIYASDRWIQTASSLSN